jgi:N-(5'phosphoribosyl)anthranilate (PRA) isomerase
MRLKVCSITGADAAVAVADLSAIADQFPFVEWGILVWPEQASTARCPPRAWIEAFAKEYAGRHRALHLCGQALLDFLAGRDEMLRLMVGFQRIQLNLSVGGVGERIDLAALAKRIAASPQWEFILQYARDQHAVLPRFEAIPNHALLFDDSAGRGVLLGPPNAPIPGHFCGYAGGLTPDNVKAMLGAIAQVVGEGETWIDMESGVRTDDRFDLNKVRRVLAVAESYWTPGA